VVTHEIESHPQGVAGFAAMLHYPRDFLADKRDGAGVMDWSQTLPSPDTPLGTFIAELSQLVLDEAEAARRQVQQTWTQPLAARVAAGRAIADVRVVHVAPDGLITLACPRNESRFREGDVLCLNRDSPFFEPTLLVTLEADEETELLVSTDDPAAQVGMALSQLEGWTLDEGFLDVSHAALDALHQAADTVAGREQILPLLAGQRRPRIDPDRYDHADARAAAWGLNTEQRDAVASAYACELAALIQGPPGTGKTLALARLAQLLAEDGERVLITAFTHRAINNALNTLAALDARGDTTPITAVKIGRAARTDDLRVANYDAFNTSPLADLTGAYVVGATPFALRTYRLSGVEFDTVIFDEASQITLPLAIMGMLAARRFVFVGDHKQLPPVLTTRHGDRTLRDSVFGALVGRGFDVMLEESYRLNADLAAWPSAQFYEERLRPAPAIATRRVVYQRQPERFAAILDPAEPKVFVNLGHQNATTRSDREADLAVNLILELLASGVPASEIGVVTPYRAQARAIRGLLRQAMPDDRAQRRAIVVDTVERMQGQERDVVIVSLTTSQATFAAEIADFLFQPERLNVAITRPRAKLIILGSRALLDVQPDDPEHQEWVALLADLVASCSVGLRD
jgi:DNA replication ATP-dependent helicase Dna2